VLLIADQDAAEHACKRAREHPSRLEQAMATSVLSQGSIVRVERERIGEHIHTNSLFNQRHKSKRKCNRTTMPGSEDGKKLYYAARDGKDEEVERLLKMGVKPDDYSMVHIAKVVPPSPECAETPVTTPDCNTIEPLRGIEPLSLLSSLIPHTSPRALNLDGVAHRVSLLQGGWGSHCCWLQCQPVTHSRSLTVF